MAETFDALPETGAMQGDIYYVYDDPDPDNNGLYVWDNEEGWVKLNVAAGPRGLPGERGVPGADGIIGPIMGVVDAQAQLPTSGVSQGDIYYVVDDPDPANNGLYVYDEQRGWVRLDLVQGPRGATGATGPTGPEASSYTIVPFASQVAPRTHSLNGRPTRVSLLGFGYGDSRANDLVTDYSIPLDSSDGHFALGDNGNYQLVFSLPFDMAIRSIALTTGTWDDWTFENAVYPYVQLFYAAPASNTFFPIPGGVAKPATAIGPGAVQGDTMVVGLVEDLDIRFTAGTRIAIGAQMETVNATTPPGDEGYWLYFTGAIGFSR